MLRVTVLLVFLFVLAIQPVFGQMLTDNTIDSAKLSEIGFSVKIPALPRPTLEELMFDYFSELSEKYENFQIQYDRSDSISIEASLKTLFQSGENSLSSNQFYKRSNNDPDFIDFQVLGYQHAKWLISQKGLWESIPTYFVLVFPAISVKMDKKGGERFFLQPVILYSNESGNWEIEWWNNYRSTIYHYEVVVVGRE